MPSLNVDIGLNARGLTLIRENLTRTMRLRGTHPSQSEYPPRRAIHLQGPLGDLTVKLSIMTGIDQQIQIVGDVRRANQRLRLEFWSDEQEYLGMDHALLSNRVEQVLLRLFDNKFAPEADKNVGKINIHPQTPPLPGIREVQTSEEQEKVQFTEESWQTYRQGKLTWEGPFHGLVYAPGGQIAMLLRKIKRIAPGKGSVLILGETGSGKEGIARAIHELSGRSGKYLISNALEFSAEDHTVAAGKLFGYGPGTGFKDIPAAGRIGAIEDADGGTLFLDEIADLPMEIQKSLLRVLDGKPFRPAAGDVSQEIKCNVRYLGATNKDFKTEIRAGNIRQDFYERLKSYVVEVPPLRERLEDIPALIAYFAHQQGNQVQYAEDLFKALLWHPWPGNVRQLKKLIEATQITDEKT